MTNDSNKKDTQGSNFREQILRDLERLREKRLATHQPNKETVENILAEIEAKPVAEKEVEPTPEEHSTVELPEIDSVPVVPLDGDAVEDDQVKLEHTKEEILVSEAFPEAIVADYFPLSHEEEGEKEIEPEQEESEHLDLDATRIHQAPTLSSVIEEEDSQETLIEPVLIAEGPAQKEVMIENEPTSQEGIPATSSAQLSRKAMKKHRKQQEKVAKRIVTAVIVIVLLAIGVTGVAGYSYFKSSLDPIDAQSTENVQVKIPEGSTTMQIGQILFEKDLIKNPTIFNYYAKLKSYNNFQSGFYNLNQSMSLDELAKALQETGAAAPQEPVAGKVLVVEGYTLEQISKAVTDKKIQTLSIV